MKIEINQPRQYDIKYVHVVANVRYWEDGTVNGMQDNDDNPTIPCSKGDSWNILIDVDNGQIVNWEKNISASVHYKVCDCCSIVLKDRIGQQVFDCGSDYVPDFLSIGDEGYGDYIILDIDKNGFIKDWKIDEDDLQELIDGGNE